MSTNSNKSFSNSNPNANNSDVTISGSLTLASGATLNVPIGSIPPTAINGLLDATHLSQLPEQIYATLDEPTNFTAPVTCPQLNASTIMLSGSDLGGDMSSFYSILTTIQTKQTADEANITNHTNSINALITKTQQFTYNSSYQYTEVVNLLVDYYLTTSNLILNTKLTANSRDITATQLSYLSNLTSDVQNQINSKQRVIDASVDVYGKNVSGDSINVRNYLTVNGANIPASVLSNLQCMDILNSSSLTTTSLNIHDQIQQAAFAFTGLNSFLQAPLYLGTDTNPPSNTFITRSYVDIGLATKQATITNSTNLSCNTLTTVGSITIPSNDSLVTVGNNVTLLPNTNCLSTPKILLNGTDINTQFMALNNAVCSNGLTINSINQNGVLFNSGLTMNYGSYSNQIAYNIVPQYLPTFWTAGSTFSTNSGVPGLYNQTCYLNWAIPTSIYGTGCDAVMNWCIVEITYIIQESPINGSRTTYFPVYSPVNAAGTYTTTTVNSSTSTVNMTINTPAISCTCQYYIATSLSRNSASGVTGATSGYNSYVKYLSGSSTITSNQSMYQTNFTPLQFYYQGFNKFKIQFNYPNNNNTTSSNPYGGNNYISAYGCSVRIVSSNADNASNAANLYPSNATSQAVNSFSFVGRAYLSNN
jgi:hypothetical protein